MNAKEMFKKQDYKIKINDKTHLLYVHENDMFGICFYKDCKEVLLAHPSDCLDYSKEFGMIHSCQVEEHKAIHQQMIELGWIDS